MILIADDHADTRKLLLRLFKIDGYEAVAVESGEAALRFFEAQTPRLVVLDYGMPDVNGLDVLKRIKKDPRLSKIPVIMFSAYDGQKREEALHAGVDAYIMKGSLDWAFMQKEIKRLIGPASAARELPIADDRTKRHA